MSGWGGVYVCLTGHPCESDASKSSSQAKKPILACWLYVNKLAFFKYSLYYCTKSGWGNWGQRHKKKMHLGVNQKLRSEVIITLYFSSRR